MTLVQTSPKKIYLGNNEAKAVYLGENKVRPPYKPAQESIVIKMKADSYGQLQVPRAGYSAYGSLASYNWKISYDGGAETTYSGSGNQSSNIIIATGLTAGSEHTITIIPVTESYGWARAFGFGGVASSNTIGQFLTEVIYDGSYMGYGVSTATGDFFRYRQYLNCSNLTKIYKEVLPDTVTAIGNSFRSGQYSGCTSLITAPQEILPNTVTSIGNDFRRQQYYGCTSLTSTAEEALPSSVTSIGQIFRGDQYSGCTALNEIKGWKDLSISGQYYRLRQYNNCTTNKTVKVLSNVGAAAYDTSLSNSYITTVSVPSAYLNNFKNATIYPRSQITDSKFVGY